MEFYRTSEKQSISPSLILQRRSTREWTGIFFLFFSTLISVSALFEIWQNLQKLIYAKTRGPCSASFAFHCCTWYPNVIIKIFQWILILPFLKFAFFLFTPPPIEMSFLDSISVLMKEPWGNMIMRKSSSWGPQVGPSGFWVAKIMRRKSCLHPSLGKSYLWNYCTKQGRKPGNNYEIAMNIFFVIREMVPFRVSKRCFLH